MQRTRHVSSLREGNIQDVVTDLQQLHHEAADIDGGLKGLSTLETLTDLMQLPGNACPCQTAHRPLWSPQVRARSQAFICMPVKHAAGSRQTLDF